MSLCSVLTEVADANLWCASRQMDIAVSVRLVSAFSQEATVTYISVIAAADGQGRDSLPHVSRQTYLLNVVVSIFIEIVYK
jgi:hypothetical protein